MVSLTRTPSGSVARPTNTRVIAASAIAAALTLGLLGVASAAHAIDVDVTITPSAQPSIEPTASASPSASPSASASASPSPSAEPTSTPTTTVSPTPSTTASMTPSTVPTAAPPATPSASADPGGLPETGADVLPFAAAGVIALAAGAAALGVRRSRRDHTTATR